MYFMSTYPYFYIPLFLQTLIFKHPYFYIPLFIHILISTYPYFYILLFLNTLISTYPYFYIPIFLHIFILFRFISVATCPSVSLPTYPIPYNFGFILIHCILLQVTFTKINCCFVLLSETIPQDSVYCHTRLLLHLFYDP